MKKNIAGLTNKQLTKKEQLKLELRRLNKLYDQLIESPITTALSYPVTLSMWAGPTSMHNSQSDIKKIDERDRLQQRIEQINQQLKVIDNSKEEDDAGISLRSSL